MIDLTFFILSLGVPLLVMLRMKLKWYHVCLLFSSGFIICTWIFSALIEFYPSIDISQGTIVYVLTFIYVYYPLFLVGVGGWLYTLLKNRKQKKKANSKTEY